LDQYTEIYQDAPRWLQNAMNLVLITLQRLEDIVSMQFDDYDGQHLFAIQKKLLKRKDGKHWSYITPEMISREFRKITC
jgi:hypothetical protein